MVLLEEDPLATRQSRVEGTPAAHTLARLVDHLALPVILVDGSGHAVAYNRAAAEIFDQADGISLNSHGVTFETKTAELKALLARLRSNPGAIEDDFGDVISVPRPSGARPYCVTVFPIGEAIQPNGASQPNGAGEPLVALFVYDLDCRRLIPREHWLRRLYGLTRTEARVATLLAHGMSVDEIADRLGVSMNTVRTHVRHILAKTDTPRQSALIRLIYSGPGQLVLRLGLVALGP